MFSFAAITPHPPIIIPSVGSMENLKKTKKTVNAMKTLTAKFEKTETETVILISPHGPVDFENMGIINSSDLSGDLSSFGYSSIKLDFKNDTMICDEIKKGCKTQNIPIRKYDETNLDHGCIVPLYYLCQKTKPKVVPLAYSLLDNFMHFSFGKLLGKIAKESSEKIGIVASGDLSHRLIPEAPAGYSPRAKKFDEKLNKLLSSNDVNGILNIDKDLIEEAGECGYKSIIILLGALSLAPNFKFEILSYEGPFGVGYLVANAKID